MVQTFIMIIFALCFSGSALAVACKSVNRSELERCGAENARISDETLNATYKLVKSRIPNDEVDRLVEVQRLWLQFRDDACKKAWLENVGGTEANYAKLSCISKESDLRTKELKYQLVDGDMYGFYSHLHIEKARWKVSFMENTNQLAAEISASKDPGWIKYVEHNCEMSYKLLGEDRSTCYARQAFYAY